MFVFPVASFTRNKNTKVPPVSNPFPIGFDQSSSSDFAVSTTDNPNDTFTIITNTNTHCNIRAFPTFTISTPYVEMVIETNSTLPGDLHGSAGSWYIGPCLASVPNNTLIYTTENSVSAVHSHAYSSYFNPTLIVSAQNANSHNYQPQGTRIQVIWESGSITMRTKNTGGNIKTWIVPRTYIDTGDWNFYISYFACCPAVAGQSFKMLYMGDTPSSGLI